MKYLARTEELILLAALKLKDNAYGVTIRELVIESTQKKWSIGAIYDILDQLERKGFVSTKIGQPTAERGGRSKKFFEITESGYNALIEVKEVQQQMWMNTPKPIFK